MGPFDPLNRTVAYAHHLITAALLLLALLFFSPARAHAQDGGDHDTVLVAVPRSALRGLLAEKAPSARMPGPFQAWAFDVKGSSLGVGVDLVTTLATRANLRVGVNLLNMGANFSAAGFAARGEARLRSGSGSIDLFPFRGGFHISPGLTWRHTTSLSGSLTVPAGGTFYLGGQAYTSSTSDPVWGYGTLVLGTRKLAPQVTVGWGNVIPRSGRHLSVPIEFGVQYVGAPTTALSLHGSACQPVTYKGQTANMCQSLDSNSAAQANIAAEVQRANSRLSMLQYYPIGSIGLGYRF